MSAPAVARLSSPGEVVAVLPVLCGFRPSDSLVVVSLRGPRRRVGLTARVDLPPEDEDVEAAVAGALAERAHADGASAVVLVVYADDGQRDGLVAQLLSACSDRGLEVCEALHVAADRWTSYRCSAPCCPPEGTPVPRDAPVLRQVQAERTLAGQVVLGSRDELVRSLAPPVPTAAAGRLLQEEQAAWSRFRTQCGRTASSRATLTLADGLLDAVAAGRPVTPEEAARLAVGLGDVAARDEVAVRMLRRSDELLSLLQQVVRLVGAPYDAPACTLLAWTAYARGNGGVANVALDRALGSSPGYPLADLLRSCLDRGVPPEDVRATVRCLTTPG